jgi:hypothetical protein
LPRTIRSTKGSLANIEESSFGRGTIGHGALAPLARLGNDRHINENLF